MSEKERQRGIQIDRDKTERKTERHSPVEQDTFSDVTAQETVNPKLQPSVTTTLCSHLKINAHQDNESDKAVIIVLACSATGPLYSCEVFFFCFLLFSPLPEKTNN